MTNLKDIKNRINSIQSTKKITRAMKMVAAAKVKKAETKVKASRPFTLELKNMFSKMLSSIDDGSFAQNLLIKSSIDNYPKLLENREIKNVGLLIMTSNKGLAGAYNSNIVRKTIDTIQKYNAQNIGVKLFIIGQKGDSGLRKKVSKLNTEIIKTYYNVIDKADISNVYYLLEDLAELFVKGEIDKIELITTRFKNMLSYFVENWQILPLEDVNYDNKFDGIIESMMEFEPNKQSILQQIVPMYLTNIVYQAVLEAQASELASRMTAMSAAYTNAEKILHELSIEHNKIRQAAITNEIVEVVSGANAQME